MRSAIDCRSSEKCVECEDDRNSTGVFLTNWSQKLAINALPRVNPEEVLLVLKVARSTPATVEPSAERQAKRQRDAADRANERPAVPVPASSEGTALATGKPEGAKLRFV